MRILIVEPDHASAARGNVTTVARWRRHLARRGVRTRIVAPAALASPSVLEGVDLVHAHHAVHAGVPALAACRKRGLPLVVSVGGTDLHGALGEGLPEAAREVFASAAVVVGPFDADAARLATALGREVPFQRVRRGVERPPRPAPNRFGAPLRILVAGGLRPIKGQDRALDWLDGLRSRGIAARLAFAGPILDTEFAAALRERAQGRDDVAILGVLEPGAMPLAYARCDVLWNVSKREGASNAILEAWAQGRPVVARRAPGNEELLAGAPPLAARLVDEDDATLEDLAVFLRDLGAEGARERGLRVSAARDHVAMHHHPSDEAAELLRAWGRAFGTAEREISGASDG